MRKLACLAGAATIALASLAGASTASAHPDHHNWHNGAIGFGVAGLAAGALLGSALADSPEPAPVPLYGPPPPAPVYVYDNPVPVYEAPAVPVYRVVSQPRHGWDAHVRACERAYNSYDPASNTYIAANGQILTCRT